MFKFTPQYDQMDCGPACLRMVAIKYGKDISLQFLRDNCFITRDGVSLLGIGIAAEKIGFNRFVTKLTSDDLEKLAPFLVFYIGIKTILLSYTE